MSLPRLFLNRVSVETKKLSQDLPPEITCWPEEEDKIGIFRAVMKGPLDSPYAGGIFTLRIVLPQRYPHEPPKVNFLTRIYHPNVDDKGRICLDILKSLPKGTWTSGQNIMSTLMSIYSLLSNPNADDPLDIEATTFNETVKNTTKLHATGEDTEKNLGDDVESLEFKESESSVRRPKPTFSLKKGKINEAKAEKELSTTVSNDLASPKVISTFNVSKKQPPKIFSLKKLKENKKEPSSTKSFLPDKEPVSYSSNSLNKLSLASPLEAFNQSPPREAIKRSKSSDPKSSADLKKIHCLNVSGDNVSKLDNCEISKDPTKAGFKSTDSSSSRDNRVFALTKSFENNPEPESSNFKSNRKPKKFPKEKDAIVEAVLNEPSFDKGIGAEESGDSKIRASSEKNIPSSEILNGDENHLKPVKKNKSKIAPRKITDISDTKDYLEAAKSSIKAEPPASVSKAPINSNFERYNVLKSNTITEISLSPKINNEGKHTKTSKSDLVSRRKNPLAILSSDENSPRSTSPTLPKKDKVNSKIIHRLPTPNLDAPPHPMKDMYDVMKSTSPGSVIKQHTTTSNPTTNQKIKSVSLDQKAVSSKRKSLSDVSIGKDLLDVNEPKSVVSLTISEVPLTEHQSPELEPSHLPTMGSSPIKNIPITSSGEHINTKELSQDKNLLHPENNLPTEKKRGWRPSPLRPTGKGAQEGSGPSRRPTFSLKKLRKN